MRILFVHAGAELYGADRILLELVGGLIDRGHGAIVVLPGPGPLVEPLQRAGARVHLRSLGVLRRKYFTIGGLLGRCRRMLAATFWLTRLIRTEKVDLVHTNTSVVFPGAFAALLARRPHVWHIHEITTRPVMVRRMLSFLVPRLSACVVCVSRSVEENLLAGSARFRHKFSVIYNGISPLEFRPDARGRVRAEFGVADDSVLVGMVGRVNRWKGQGALVESARLLFERGATARYLMVGGTVAGEESRMHDLQRKVSESGLESIITVCRFRTDVADLLSAMDVFVLPSTEPDPFPTVVLEAMGAGLPVVAFPHGGVREMIEDGVSGVLATAMEPKALAASINSYLTDPARRLAAGRAARQRVATAFSRNRFLDGFEALYRRLTRQV